MALADALLELATSWRQLVPSLWTGSGGDPERLLAMAAFDNDDEAIEVLVGNLVEQLPRSHHIVRALEAPRLRREVETELAPVAWPRSEPVLFPKPSSELSFIAFALLREIVEAPAAPWRAAARLNTLGRLSRQNESQAFLLGVSERTRASSHIPLPTSESQNCYDCAPHGTNIRRIAPYVPDHSRKRTRAARTGHRATDHTTGQCHSGRSEGPLGCSILVDGTQRPTRKRSS